MQFKNIMTVFAPVALAASLSACGSPHYAAKGEPVCQRNGDGGYEAVDSVTNSIIYETNDIQESGKSSSYEWGKVDGIPDLGFNVHLKNDEISWCEVTTGGSVPETMGTYYPKAPTP